MRFFIPAVYEKEEVEETYAFMREYATKETGLELSSRRIDTVQFPGEKGVKTISVGEWVLGGTVQCIFEGSGPFVVLTTRAGSFGVPILIDRAAVVGVNYFEGFEIDLTA